ncbi:MAG: hypothetical protein ITF98_03850 [Fermentimonas sp.]|nr:hypothetical protein [Fermentimonas sp.]
MNSDNEIKKQFKSKFDDFKVPIPSDGWDQIEESLNSIVVVQNHNVHRIWRIVGSVAAVAILIFGSLLFLKPPIEQEDTYISDATEKTSSIEADNSESVKQTSSSDIVKPTKEELFVQKKNDVNKREDVIYESKEEIILDEVVETLAEVHESFAKEIASFDIVDDKIIEEITLIIHDQDKLLAEHFVEQEDNRLVLSLGGKGGLTSFYQSVNTPMTLRSATVASDNQFLDESDKMLFQQNILKDNIAEMEHNQPVSFGLTVSKSIIDGLNIETGLVYSYLYSKSKNTSTSLQNRQTQSLHYLGIPLNLNYNLFSLKNLNVYASLGGLIEKDVYGKFSEEGESQSADNDMKTKFLRNETISQRNPQLSVNAGLGLSYPLYRDLKLYGKIGGAYYFDAKNDFKTIYSDSKIVMDLSIGIRYEFK